MSRLSHVFLFDSDAKGRDTLVYGLEGDAVSVQAPASGDEARAMLRAGPRPEVIVVVLREEREAQSLLRYLAETSSLTSIPRLVLTAAEALPENLQGLAGPQSFIPLPAYVRDVITAAKLLGAGAAGKDETETRIQGPLSDYGLLFIVRTMVGLHRSGVVEVERGTRKGQIRIAEGEIIGAEVGAREGQGALHQLLLWEEAKLQITFRPVARRVVSIPQGEALLEDLDRFLREFSNATKNIGHAQSLFVQDAEKVAAAVDAIVPEIIPVMKLFDGQRNLGDVLEDSPFPAFETLGTITQLIELGILRRKAIEKPSTGMPSQARKPRVEEWVNRGADAAVVVNSVAAPAPEPPAASGSTGNSGEQRSAIGHRRRSRRRTGEIPAVADGGARSATPPSGSPRVPLAAGTAPPPRGPLAASPAEAVAPAANGLRATSASRPGRREGEQQEVHGELRALNKDRSITPLPADMPKVLVDLGPIETISPEPEPAAVARQPTPSSEAIPVPITEELNLTAVKTKAPVGATSLGDTQPIVSPAAPPAPNADAVPTALRDTGGVRSAEIDTGQRPAPPAELLEAPPSGPSIMLDPHLVAEMDAFELANTAATPPPQVTAPPPAAEAPRPAPAPTGAIVSFVKGPANASPHAGLNTAATVPMSPVTTASGGSGGAVPSSQSRGGTPAEGITKRRASGEFNELEADFFAREKDLYQNANEPAESFDDLDPTSGNKGGPKPGPRKS